MIRKKILFFSFLFSILFVKQVDAFFVPGSLQILGSTLSNLFVFLLVALGSILLSTWRIIKTQSDLRKFIFIGVAVGAILSITLLIHLEYSTLSNLNVPSSESTNKKNQSSNQDQSIIKFVLDESSQPRIKEMTFNFTEDKEILQKQLELILKNTQNATTVCYDSRCVNESLHNYDTDCDGYDETSCFDFLTRQIFNHEIILGISDIQININNINRDELTENYALFSTFRINEQSEEKIINFEFDEYVGRELAYELISGEIPADVFSEYKNKTILVFCHGGSTGRDIAAVLRTYGFDAHSFSFRKIQNAELLDSDKLKKISDENAIIINEYPKRDYDRKDVYLEFRSGGAYEYQDFDRDVTIIPEEFEKDAEKYYFNISQEDLINSNLICTTNIECRMLQYYLYEEGLAQEIDQIYLNGD
ncbi:MAG: hypothetical protein ACLFNK_03490 [Candidatus Woesearchaeota archaeon]